MFGAVFLGAVEDILIIWQQGVVRVADDLITFGKRILIVGRVGKGSRGPCKIDPGQHGGGGAGGDQPFVTRGDLILCCTPGLGILQIADDLLAARIVFARGNKPAAIALLRDAVSNQDQLLYNEPADWYFDTRESLGGMLLANGDAAGAELVFRESLSKNPRNPRSLFGLSSSLRQQGRYYESSLVQKQFETAWQGADVVLTINDL